MEEDQGREQLIRRGLPEEVVDKVIQLVDRAEYKRRQAPPGIKISPRAFGRDRRLPITNKFRARPSCETSHRARPRPVWGSSAGTSLWRANT